MHYIFKGKNNTRFKTTKLLISEGHVLKLSDFELAKELKKEDTN